MAEQQRVKVRIAGDSHEVEIEAVGRLSAIADRARELWGQTAGDRRVRPVGFARPAAGE
jgi:hypothetical protein